MIVHKYPDGSEGYEYELGDVVEITGTVNGGWFNHAVGKSGPIVELSGRAARKWMIDPVYVRHSTEWGPTHCMPWQVEPTPETREAATVVAAP